MSNLPKSFSVLGLPVHVMANYPNWLQERIESRQGAHVVTLNAEMTMQAERNKPLAKVIQSAELVIPDGAGVVLYLQLLLRQKVNRVPGIELAEALLQNLGQSNSKLNTSKVFFYGGSPGVAQKAADYWKSQSSELMIAGTHSGYHSEAEEQQLKETLAEIQPQLILVGLGVPRQEMWISQNRHLCPQAVWIGVGGSFDIWSGVKTRAPHWLGNNHLEWLYRLYKEPWRWKRMMSLPEFAFKSVVYCITDKCAVSQ
ncbi:WecB/TagA/CpsF family glycosyl transferase [Calothrix sp. NIES-4071]|nr:WecB/TagA/CpsF family glycosyl transferase [Calothrix sp. NIES-4071]BAZ63375.1 WecB/TagA/CpsF family glycosyl transferase [Calothrix sp. NIES-4105]